MKLFKFESRLYFILFFLYLGLEKLRGWTFKSFTLIFFFLMWTPGQGMSVLLCLSVYVSCLIFFFYFTWFFSLHLVNLYVWTYDSLINYRGSNWTGVSHQRHIFCRAGSVTWPILPHIFVLFLFRFVQCALTNYLDIYHLIILYPRDYSTHTLCNYRFVCAMLISVLRAIRCEWLSADWLIAPMHGRMMTLMMMRIYMGQTMTNSYKRY